MKAMIYKIKSELYAKCNKGGYAWASVNNGEVIDLRYMNIEFSGGATDEDVIKELKELKKYCEESRAELEQQGVIKSGEIKSCCLGVWPSGHGILGYEFHSQEETK